jgi:hypothetical protein
MLEDIDHYLDRKHGVDGIPLAYVVRTSVDIPAGAPAYGLPSFDAEMITRARHESSAYLNSVPWRSWLELDFCICTYY